MWPKKGVPKEYYRYALRLVTKVYVTKREFIDLCLLAVKYIDAGKTTLHSRSLMAMYIANLWLRHKNISDVSLLSEIGGQFGDWDVPGTFIIDDERRSPNWKELKSWIAEADKRYKHEPLSVYRRGVPDTFLNAADKILGQEQVTKRQYIELCMQATDIIEFNQHSLTTRKNVAFYITEVGCRHPDIVGGKLFGNISAKFSAYDAPDAFNLEFILEKQSWQQLKSWIAEADRRYPK